MDYRFEAASDTGTIPYWVVECTNEIEKSLKLNLDIEDSYAMACIILEFAKNNK